MLEAAGRAHVADKGTAPLSDETAAADGDAKLAGSNTATSLARSKDSEGRLHLAGVVSVLVLAALESPVKTVLTEAAWQATWDLLATPGIQLSVAVAVVYQEVMCTPVEVVCQVCLPAMG